MKKRIAIALVCVVLLCALAACDMEFGGIVGELLSDADLPEGGFMDSLIGVVPPSPAIDPEETYTMGPGEQLYGFPDSLNLSHDVAMLEVNEALCVSDTVGAEIIDEASVAMGKQFAELYGYELYYTQVMDGERMVELAASEMRAGSGLLMLCVLPLSDAGRVAMSGAFHSQSSLAEFSLDNGCWFDQMNADLDFGGVQYSFAGYLAPYAQYDVDCLVYNEDLMQALDYDIVAAVNNRTWVLSDYYGLCTNATQNLNGETSGAVYQKEARENMFLGCSGVDIFEGGVYAVDALSRCVTLSEDFAGLCRVSSETDDAWQIFSWGNSLFYATQLSRFAGLDGKDPMMILTDVAARVAPMPLHFSDSYVADCRRGGFISIGRSAEGDAGMAVNVLAVLATNHMQPVLDQWMTKINPSSESLDMCYTVIASARCNLDYAVLSAQGEPVEPLREGAATYMQAYKKQFEKALAQVYTSAQNNR